MLTGTRIAHAWVVVAVLNDWPESRGRNLRPLVNADFKRILKAREKIQGAWAVQKTINKSGGPVVKYYVMRKGMLDRWQSKHGWHPTTRETYASVLSVLVNWGKYGIPAKHKRILEIHLPGAELFLRHLEGYQPSLRLT